MPRVYELFALASTVSSFEVTMAAKIAHNYNIMHISTPIPGMWQTPAYQTQKIYLQAWLAEVSTAATYIGMDDAWCCNNYIHTCLCTLFATAILTYL